MTTPITQYRISHTLTGSIVPLPYDWKIDAATELLVTLVNTSVTPNIETTLVNGTDYSVSGVGSDSGGNVTTTTAYTAGWKIVITNNVPYNQAVDFTNQNSVRPEVVEQMGDSLSKQIKQIVEALTRCVKTTIGSGLSSEDLVDDLYANTAAAAASASNAATSASNAATSETSANNWAIAAQNAATGINWTKARAASTANVNIASPGASIDGVALVAADRVLLKNQTSAAQNGIYTWNGAAVAMTRATDMDTWQEVVSKVVVIEEGALNADIPYISTVNTGGTLGTTSITFIVFQPPLQDGAVSAYAKIASSVFASAAEIIAETAGKLINAANFKSGLRGLESYTLLGEYVASTSSSLNITSKITSEFDEYVFEFLNIVPSVSGAIFNAQLSSDNGSSWLSTANYSRCGVVGSSGSSSIFGINQAGVSSMDISGSLNSAARYSLSGQARLLNPLNTTNCQQLSFHLVYATTAPAFESLNGHCQYNPTTLVACNAIKFAMNTGNIASGTIRVYGIRKT